MKTEDRFYHIVLCAISNSPSSQWSYFYNQESDVIYQVFKGATIEKQGIDLTPISIEEKKNFIEEFLAKL